jgi:hypothetical protein
MKPHGRDSFVGESKWEEWRSLEAHLFIAFQHKDSVLNFAEITV